MRPVSLNSNVKKILGKKSIKIIAINAKYLFHVSLMNKTAFKIHFVGFTNTGGIESLTRISLS